MQNKEARFLWMKLPLIRFKSRRSFFMFKAGVLTALVLLLLLLLTHNSTGRIGAYFSRKCIDYKQKDFSRKLNDRLLDYASAAKKRGIVPCSNDDEIRQRVSSGRLVKVSGGNDFIIDRLTHSSPYLTGDGKKLLEEIARRFKKKTSEKGLYGARFIVTSMTRKTEGIKKLSRNNANASLSSPHLYGNAFDISYKRFKVRKMVMTNCDHKFMKEALAEIISDLRKQGKCWATYERNQNCFHVVAR